jgi:hypothetical protein
MKEIFANGPNRYEADGLVAKAGKFRLYLCKQMETGRQCLFQLATQVADNGLLDRNAFILRELKAKADELEEEYAKVRVNANDLLNYALGFPELVDSFICQGYERRANVLAFRNIEKISQMVPLRNIVVKDHRRVDLRTSAWIMGKSLKLLAFAHSLGISVGRIDATNILIEPDQHYVVFFDLSDAVLYSEIVPVEIRCREIAEAAQTVIVILGGNLKTRTFSSQVEERVQPYVEYLWQLADGNQRDAQKVHAQFYELIDGLWERAFYAFTSHPI